MHVWAKTLDWPLWLKSSVERKDFRFKSNFICPNKFLKLWKLKFILIQFGSISVFKIKGKSHYQGQKMTQCLRCAILWQNVKWFFQYFWISENFYKKTFKCNLSNMFSILDERVTVNMGWNTGFSPITSLYKSCSLLTLLKTNV